MSDYLAEAMGAVIDKERENNKKLLELIKEVIVGSLEFRGGVWPLKDRHLGCKFCQAKADFGPLLHEEHCLISRLERAVS